MTTVLIAIEDKEGGINFAVQTTEPEDSPTPATILAAKLVKAAEEIMAEHKYEREGVQ